MKINIRTSEILRRTFVRQLTDYDCGQACIAMLLRYAGKTDKAAQLLSTADSGNQSLLSLKKCLASYGFSACCVTMTMEHLSQFDGPCILHTEDSDGNMHYQVCYGTIFSCQGTMFLMADPAKQFYVIKVENLNHIWKSKAALYVENLIPDLSHFRHPPLYLVASFAYLPRAIWIVMPVLTLINAIFGVALSFLLQRGFLYTDIFFSRHIIFALVFLLLVLSLFKSGFSYLRQLIMLKINRKVRQNLFSMLTKKIETMKSASGSAASDFMKKGFHDISLIQNALSVFVATFVSEGSLLVMILATIFYILPEAGFTLLAFLLILTLSIIRSASKSLYTTASLRQAAAKVEELLTTTWLGQNTTGLKVVARESAYAAAAEKQAIRMSRKGFLHEAVGALAVVIILAISTISLYNGQISYLSLMLTVILTYVATSIVPRLSSAYILFSEGADTFLQFALRMAD